MKRTFQSNITSLYDKSVYILFQTSYQVPATCCVLNNENPDQPDPKDYDKCQQAAKEDADKESEYLYKKVYWLFVKYLV